MSRKVPNARGDKGRPKRKQAGQKASEAARPISPQKEHPLNKSFDPRQPVPLLTEEELVPRQTIYDRIFKDWPSEAAKKAALEERKQLGLMEDRSLTYSELRLSEMHWLMNMAREQLGPFYPNKGVFLDLGSGCGKACMAAALLHPFQRVVGLERLQALHRVADGALPGYREQVPQVARAEMEFINCDFALVDEMRQRLVPLAPQVILCLAVATCFGERELKAMGVVAQRMPPGAIFISFTQALPAPCTELPGPRGGWTLVHSSIMQMMWGPATCYVYKKPGVLFAPPPPLEPVVLPPIPGASKDGEGGGQSSARDAQSAGPGGGAGAGERGGTAKKKTTRATAKKGAK